VKFVRIRENSFVNLEMVTRIDFEETYKLFGESKKKVIIMDFFNGDCLLGSKEFKDNIELDLWVSGNLNCG
jgi:hypothetical protein